MVAYGLRRLGASLLTVIFTTMITFAIIQLAPGGPAILLDDRLTQDDRDQIRRNLGLDRPIAVQYVRWSSALVQGDLGNSYLQREPVITVAYRRPEKRQIVSCRGDSGILGEATTNGGHFKRENQSTSV